MTPRHYARVKEIFQAIDSLPHDQQLDALREHCKGDDALFSDVAKLLDHHDPDAAIREGRTVVQPENLQTIVNDKNVRARLKPSAARVTQLFGGNSQGLAIGLLVVCACLMSLGVAWIANLRLREHVDRDVENLLGGAVESLTSALSEWSVAKKAVGQSWGNDPALRDIVAAYAELDSSDKDALKNTSLVEQLRDEVARVCGEDVKYVVWNRSGMTLASWQPDTGDVGNQLPPEGMIALARCADGETLIQFPTRVTSPTEGFQPEPIAMIWVTLPVRDDQGNVVAVMLVRDPSWLVEYQELINRHTLAQGPDLFVLNEYGIVVSESRQAKDWIALGICEGDPSDTVATIRMADPGGRLQNGHTLTRSRASLPLTEAAARVTVGERGGNTQGYRDVTGEQVVGAWRWLGDLGVGVVAELPKDRANEFASWMRRVIAAFLAIPLCIFGIGLVVTRLLKTSDGDASEGQMAGAYELLDKIGEGGMGYVYRARHSLLKRPSAVKLLRPDRLTTVDVGRFDREVKLAAQLTSPHTVQIFDYGRTSDGLIYFAMEYLDGLTLSHVVARGDGGLPVGRTLLFLIQLCKSIEEAHSAGLVHRDIKPQNIMITRRGNEADWLILFDFGLAKSVAPNKKEFRTRETIWAGTPMFMSPERIRTPAAVDPRMDIYAIGAVGYLMLTGSDPFTAANPEMIFEQVLNDMPRSPSEVGAESIPQLDALILRCLAKDADDRPETVTLLRNRLEQLAAKHPWTPEQAKQWWQNHSRS